MMFFIMLHQSPALGLRAFCLTALSGYLALRPIVSSELNASLAIGLDLLGISAAFAVVVLAGSNRLQFLRAAKYPLLLWLAALAAAVARHGATPHSLRSDLLALAGGPVIFCAAATPWGAWRRYTAAGVGFIAALISAFAIWQGLVILPALAAQSNGSAAGHNPLLHEVAARGRVLGTFSLPILLAAYLSTVIPYIIYGINQWSRHAHKRATWLVWLALCLISIALLLTRSIGAWLSFSVACTVILFNRHRSPKTFALLMFTLGLCGGLILASRGVLWNRASAHDPVRNRLVYWSAAYALIREHPFTGAGPGQFITSYQRVTTRPELGVRHAHNTYLQIWAEYGVLGLVAWLWLLGAILLKPLRRAPWLFVAIWVLPLSNLMDFSFYIPQVCMLWWYLTGWSLCVRYQISSMNLSD